jgi:uncharacterized iron-regulated membrane protein
MAVNGDSMAGMSMEHSEHMAHTMTGPRNPHAYEPLDRMVASAVPLNLAYPVLIMPPMAPSIDWTAKSDAQNRTLRAVVTLDPNSGAVLKRENFSQRSLIDRMVGVGVAAHEGQLFGLANQLIELLTAMGLVTLSASAVVLWWRRRNVGVLGAPVPMRKPRFSFGLAALIVAFGLYLPMLGLSLIAVLLIEKFVLRRIRPAERWLGLQPNS